MIPVARPNLEGNELKYLTECIETGWISSAGRFVEEFEKEFAKFCGAKHATSCCNGTAALHLALLAAGIEEGDEVIVPNITFATTANVVLYCNAIPVLADVDKDTWNIDPEDILRKITKKTKAIIPVHLYGNPCDMDRIMKIAKEHDLIVIEDAAEAHGAEYKGKRVGSIGHIGCFSFFGNKILTTGEGGMCTTDDTRLNDKMKLLKNHGMRPERRYWHEEVGYNYRMTNLQAAVGLAQLENAETFLAKRDEIAKTYQDALTDINGITFQKPTPDTKPAQWLVSCIIHPEGNTDRDGLMGVLKEKGIDSRPLFYPLSDMPPYKRFVGEGKFPRCEKISSEGLSLPTYADLSKEEVQKICETIAEVFR